MLKVGYDKMSSFTSDLVKLFSFFLNGRLLGSLENHLWTLNQEYPTLSLHICEYNMCVYNIIKIVMLLIFQTKLIH